MYVGHYGVAFALNAAERRAPLWLLFLGVQFADILFFPLLLAGVERLTLIPGYTASTHFRLDYLPYSHGLLASLVWSALAFAAAFLALGRRDPRRLAVSLVLAASVFSHWILDLIVHVPDLPLTTDSSLKVGLGMWRNAPLAFALEAGLLVAGLALYLRAARTRARTFSARFGMVLFVALLILVQLYNLLAPPPETYQALAWLALATYFAFAGVAWWLDRARA